MKTLFGTMTPHLISPLSNGMRAFVTIIFTVISLFLILSTKTQAQNISGDSVPIAKIDFPEGQFIQENRDSGVWVEYDFMGKRRYAFDTLSYTEQYLRLQGQQGNVQILFDFENKVISGEWAGHPMAKIYDISNVIYLTPPKTEPEIEQPRPTIIQTPPKLERVEPNYVPPGKKLPEKAPKDNTPPKKEIALTDNNKDVVENTPVTPQTLKVAEYKSGKFFRQNQQNWFEKSNNGTINSLNQIAYSDNSIFLYDAGRRLMIELDIAEKTSRVSYEGRLLKTLYPLTKLLKDDAAEEDNLTSIETADRPGKLSPVERTQCLTKGGFIERSGLLAYERCTMRYSDGGNICIDSSNCEGKCLATPKSARENAVSGLCQITDNPFGCYAEVMAGAVGPTLCVD